MRSGLRRLWLGAAAAMAAGPVCAASIPALPDGADEGAVADWVEMNIDPGMDIHAYSDQQVAGFFDPASLQKPEDGHVVGWFRSEYFRPRKLDGLSFRSSRQQVEIDCAQLRVRIIATEVFAENNLMGRRTPRTMEGDWRPPLEGDAGAAKAARQACAYEPLIGSADWPRAMPPNQTGETQADSDAWIARYIDPKGDVLLIDQDVAARFFQPTEIERPVAGRLRFWMRSEYPAAFAVDDLPIHSAREHIEVDCRGLRYSVLSYETYPGANLLGRASTFTDETPLWNNAEAGSNEAVWIRAACRRADDPDLSPADAARQPEVALPDSQDVEAVADWARRNLNWNGYALASVTADTATGYLLSGLELTPEGHVMAYVRNELTSPIQTVGGPVRSSLFDMEFDCARNRWRVHASSLYNEPNLEHLAGEHLPAKPGRWDKGESGAPKWRLAEEVCGLRGLLADGVDLDEALIPPPASESEDDVVAWMVQYVEPGDYEFTAYDDLGAHFYSTEAMERTSQDYIRVWLRTEFFHPFEGAFRSARMLFEFDCDEGRARSLDVETYPGSNLLGDPVESRSEEAKWEYLSPRTSLSVTSNALCELRDEVDAEDEDSLSEPMLPVLGGPAAL